MSRKKGELQGRLSDRCQGRPPLVSSTLSREVRLAPCFEVGRKKIEQR
jgi:hypothetical protein